MAFATWKYTIKLTSEIRVFEKYCQKSRANILSTIKPNRYTQSEKRYAVTLLGFTFWVKTLPKPRDFQVKCFLKRFILSNTDVGYKCNKVDSCLFEYTSVTSIVRKMGLITIVINTERTVMALNIMSLIHIEQSHLNLPQSLKHVHLCSGYVTQIITLFKCVK